MIEAKDVAESVRGAVCVVLDELDTFQGPNADLCRYQELADAAPVFATVLSEPPDAVKTYGDWAGVDFRLGNGQVIRALFMVVRTAEGR